MNVNLSGVSGTWERYNGSSWQTNPPAPTTGDGNVSIQNPHVVNVPNAQSITVDDVTIQAGGQLTLNGSMTIVAGLASFEVNVFGTILLSGNNANISFSSAAMQLQGGCNFIHNSPFSAANISANTTKAATSNWIFRSTTTIFSPDVSLSGNYGNLSFDNSTGSPWSPALTGSADISCSNLTVGSLVSIQNNYTGNLTMNGNLTVNGTLVNGTGIQRFTFAGPSRTLNAASSSSVSGFYDTLRVASGAELEMNVNLSGVSGCVFYVFGKLNAKTFTITGNPSNSTFKFFSNSIFAFANGGIGSSIFSFQNTIAEDYVSYIVNGASANPILLFWNSNLLDLQINTSPGLTTTFWSPSNVAIYGTMTFTSGLFNLQNATLRLYGSPLAGNTANFLTTNISILQFQGTTAGHYVPAAITQLGYLRIDNPSGVVLNGNLTIHYRLTFQQGILSCGANVITILDNDPDGTLGSNDFSYANGTIIRLLKNGLNNPVLFPVGGATYQPITFNSITTSAPVSLKVSPFQTVPGGTGDNNGLFGPMYNRYWTIMTIGTNTITAIGTVTLKPVGVSPVITSSSRVAISANNSAVSYASLGASLSGVSISSTASFSAANISDLSSGDGTFLAIGNSNFNGGVYCIGPAASYTPPAGVTYQNANSPFLNVSTAVSMLNAYAFSGSVIFEIQNDYTSFGTGESFPIDITFQGNPTLTATFRPRSDAFTLINISGSMPSSSSTTGLIQLNGADYVTFDGSPGGVMGNVVRLGVRNQGNNLIANFIVKDDARNNTINAIACEAAGYSKNINIISSSGPDGNDFLTISNCELFNHGIGSPLCDMMIAAGGTGTGNAATNNLTITDNKMSNAERGINLIDAINGTINISGNSFFGYVLNPTSRNMHYGIHVNTIQVTDLSVMNNYYGGINAFATGGASLEVNDAGAIFAIQLLNNTIGSTNTVSWNIIRNVDIGNQILNQGFHGIQVAGPATITNNIIGDPSNPNSIQFHAANMTYADFKGISIVINHFGANATISDNTIQNVVFNAASGVQATYYGIFYPNPLASHTVNISGNIIRNILSNNVITINGLHIQGSNNPGSNTIVQNNKIESILTYAPTTLTGITVTAKPCTFTGNRIGNYNTPDDIYILGNNISSGFSLSGNGGLLTAEDDTVANITLLNTGSYSFRGMTVDNNGTFAHSTQRNVIRNIKTSSQLSPSITSGQSGFALTGIYWFGGTSTSQILKNNLIDGLYGLSQASAIAGITCFTVGTISANTIKNLNHSGNNFSPMPIIAGISNSGTGNTTVNNMVAIQNSGTNAIEVYGIHDSHTSANNQYHFNSVSIAGNVGSASGNSYAFFRTGTGGNFIARNNIFQNSRTGGSKNFSIGLVNGNSAAWPAGSGNYNLLYSSNTLTVGEYGTGADKSFAAWQSSTSGDLNSMNFEATFVNPSSDLHLVSATNCPLKGAGTNASGITVDFDNQSRTSPPGIGADEITFPCNITFNVKAFIQGYYRGPDMQLDSIKFISFMLIKPSCIPPVIPFVTSPLYSPNTPPPKFAWLFK